MCSTLGQLYEHASWCGGFWIVILLLLSHNLIRRLRYPRDSDPARPEAWTPLQLDRAWFIPQSTARLNNVDPDDAFVVHGTVPEYILRSIRVRCSSVTIVTVPLTTRVIRLPVWNLLSVALLFQPRNRLDLTRNRWWPPDEINDKSKLETPKAAALLCTLLTYCRSIARKNVQTELRSNLWIV